MDSYGNSVYEPPEVFINDIVSKPEELQTRPILFTLLQVQILNQGQFR
jgi:hypothetical protein